MNEKNISKKNKKIIILVLVITVPILFINYQVNKHNYRLKFNLREMRKQIQLLDEGITKVQLNRSHPVSFRISIYMTNVTEKNKSIDILNKTKEITIMNLENILKHYDFKPYIYIYLNDGRSERASYIYSAHYLKYTVETDEEVIDNYETWYLTDRTLNQNEVEENN